MIEGKPGRWLRRICLESWFDVFVEFWPQLSVGAGNVNTPSCVIDQGLKFWSEFCGR